MPFDPKTELNEEQYLAATHDSGPLLILAGAGSGKTRALTYRAAHLVATGKAGADNVLLLTFTNKAAGEMQERLKKLIGSTLPFASTFHSFSARILRKYGHHLGMPPNYVIYDDADQQDLVKTIIKDMGLSPKQYSARSIHSQISAAKNELITPKAYESLARGEFQKIVSDIYHRYQTRLKQASAVDFDDLLLYMVRLLETTPVLEILQNKFQYVLVDEYQDTNRAQYLIAKYITGTHKNITAVGDASQSIYKWRGADYRNLDFLKNDFPELTTIKLEQNYRSTQTILDAATSVISRNTSHPILKLWTHQSGGELINLYEAADQTDEASYIVRKIKNDPALQTAILYRTNAQSRALEEALIRSGIPYLLVGGTKFYERKEIKDVLAYLRLMVNPADEISVARAAKIGKNRLRNLEAYRTDLDHTKLTTIELFDQILSITKYLDKYDEAIEEDVSRIENVKELRSVASQFDNPSDFLENVALVENNRLAGEANTWSKDQNPVTLMTIHSAKGLEFDQVFVIGLEEGLFPHSRSLLDQSELEEERRLCYVAITRAKSYLHLTYARSRVYYGGGGSGIVSRFISEIPEHLLKSGVRSNNFNGYKLPSSWAETYTIDNSDLDGFLDDEVDIDELLKR